MSVTSSATALRDREVPSPNSFRNRLLLITITRGDGTPMDASSILEEDIMEICIQRAHTHPLGVLQYSMAESVIYLEVSKMWTMHIILYQMWWNYMMRPSQFGQWLQQRHMLPHSSKCGIQTQLQGMENHILLPTNLLHMRRHRTISMLSLEILMIVSFDSSLRISHRRSHSAN